MPEVWMPVSEKWLLLLLTGSWENTFFFKFCCFAGFPLLILAVDTGEIKTEGIRADVVAPFNVAYYNIV